MKKLFTLLLLLVATASSALAEYENVELYLTGTFNGWNVKDANQKFTNNGDGTFTLKFKGTLVGDVKITNGAWDQTDYNIGGWYDYNTVVLGTPLNVDLNSKGTNIYIKDAVENPTLVLNHKDKQLTVTGQEAKPEYVWKLHTSTFTGDNTKWEPVDMTEEADGTWTCYSKEWKKGEFGLKKCLKGAADGSWFSAKKGEGTIDDSSINVKKSVADSDNENFKSSLEGEATLVFDPAKMQLWVRDFTVAVSDLAGESAPAVYYNMQGVRMPQGAVAPGIYVVKQGGKTSKVLVK